MVFFVRVVEGEVEEDGNEGDKGEEEVEQGDGDTAAAVGVGAPSEGGNEAASTGFW